MKTLSSRKESVQRAWLAVDLEGKPLGRAASKVASILRGKLKPIFTPHVDTGDYVVALNAAKLELSGKKGSEPIYRHSGYPGGLKTVTKASMLAKRPERLFREAVRGMLPKGPLGRDMLRKLRVYPAADHPHGAQKPQKLEI